MIRKTDLNILKNLRKRALSRAAAENRPAWRKDHEREALALERAIALLDFKETGASADD